MPRLRSLSGVQIKRGAGVLYRRPPPTIRLYTEMPAPISLDRLGGIADWGVEIWREHDAHRDDTAWR